MTAWRSFSAEERFWMRVIKSDGCWLWTSPRDKDGYGRFRLDKKPGEAKGRMTRVHRFSLELHGVTIAANQQTLHHCDSPPCVRPSHLYAGTSLDNGRDMREKTHARRSNGGLFQGTSIRCDQHNL